MRGAISAKHRCFYPAVISVNVTSANLSQCHARLKSASLQSLHDLDLTEKTRCTCTVPYSLLILCSTYCVLIVL